jgi:hypothetical protein
MKVAITLLAILALVAGAIAEYRTRADDFAGWGVIFLAIGVILLENF